MNAERSNGDVLIRPLRPEDADPLFAAVQESANELRPWLPWCHADYSQTDTMAFLNAQPQRWQDDLEYAFGIWSASDGRFLGGVGLNFIDRENSIANLGYWVRTSAARCGIATAAVRLLAEFAFTELKFSRVVIVAELKNVPSQRVAEKAGARREATMRNWLMPHGRRGDVILYSFLPEDLR